MKEIKCPYDLNRFILGEPLFKNTFSKEECEKRKFYGDCFHCFATAIARRDHQLQELREQQPNRSNRCDSCIHSEEQDGSNCYECVKGMADNFEARPTNADCISREEVMKCFEKWQPYMATRLWDYEQELRAIPSVTPSYNSIKTELKPCEDCISRKAILEWIDESLRQYGGTYSTDMLNMWGLFKDWIGKMPTVQPQSK